MCVDRFGSEQVNKKELRIAAVMAGSSTDPPLTTKKEYCKFHFSPTGCARTGTCRFAHSEAEIGEIIADYQKMNAKMTMCRYWQMGKCWHKGGKCGYAHGEEEKTDVADYKKKKGLMHKSDGSFWDSTTRRREGHAPTTGNGLVQAQVQVPRAMFVMIPLLLLLHIIIIIKYV